MNPALRLLARSTVLLLSVLVFSAASAETAPGCSGSVLAEFNRRLEGWAGEYAAGRATLGEGREIAADRAFALKELAGTRPSAVLDVVLDDRVRAELPAEFQPYLEQRISAMGDLNVICVCLREGGDRMEREVVIDGASHPVASFGRRLKQTSKRNIPLQGVLVGGVFVLGEDAIERISEAPAGVQVVDTETILDPSLSVLGRSGGRVYRFASAVRLEQAEASIGGEELSPGPAVRRTAQDIILNRLVSAMQVGTPEWTMGHKKVLVIRVDYADAPGDPKCLNETFPLSRIQDVMDNQVAPFFDSSSFHKVSLATTFTRIYRMKYPVAEYAQSSVNVMRDEALAAAEADYPGPYDLKIIVTTDLQVYPDTKYTFAGIAYLGESGLIVNGQFSHRVVSHELGHNFGLVHANAWTVKDGNAISTEGVSTEYADPFDVMGDSNQSLLANHDFSAAEKYRIRWLNDAQVKHLSQDGTYRVYGADYADRGPGELVALKVNRDEKSTYWISYRPSFHLGTATRSTNANNGAYIVWQSNEPTGVQNLLDMVTPGDTPLDACLPVGDTFSEPGIGLTLEVLDKGGTGSGQYLDVRVMLRSSVQIEESPLSQTTNPNENATFSVKVANTNATYQWQVSSDGGLTWVDAAGEHYSGSQSSSLSVLSTTAEDNHHQFRCRVSVDGQSVNSRVATLTVGIPPAITRDIGDVTLVLKPGETATLTVGLEGSDLSYFWYGSEDGHNLIYLLDGGAYSGTSTNALTIRADESMVGMRFCLNASNANGYVQSGWARLRIRPVTNHLMNLSTRCQVGTGDSIGIMGLVVNQRSRVLLRAVGPTLKQYGVGNALSKPMLKLMKDNEVLATNTGWKTASSEDQGLVRDMAEHLGAFALVDDADSALTPVLDPGIYTVHVSGANEQTGVALIEAYLDRPAETTSDHFSNLSSRIHVGTGDDQGIVGLVLEKPATVLLRAVGPSLGAYGVSGLLEKPVLQLVKDGTVIASNSGWRRDASAVEKLRDAAEQCGAFALNSADDSVLLVKLPSGRYTAMVSGANGTAGNVLVEAYLVY